MISFDKLFDEVLKTEHISIYRLYEHLNVSRSQIYRFKTSNLRLSSVDNILQILYEETGKIYQLSDICEFIPEQQNNNEKKEEG